MVLPQRLDMLQGELFIAFLKPFEHLFQGIGRFTHRRNDDEQVLLVVDDLAQIPHAVGIPHRRASEFVDFHGISLFNLTNLPYHPEATNRRTTFRMQNSECTMTKNVQLSTSNFSAFQL